MIPGRREGRLRRLSHNRVKQHDRARPLQRAAPLHRKHVQHARCLQALQEQQRQRVQIHPARRLDHLAEHATPGPWAMALPSKAHISMINGREMELGAG